MSKKPTKKIKGNKNLQKVYKRPLLAATLKSLALIFVIMLALTYSDKKGYFNPDQKNNHTEKKWKWFYKLTKKNNIDILLMGNSHLYSGINPKNLSAALGVNSFIIASPGTTIADSYFGLKEALKSCSPKLVVIETYGINNSESHKLKEGGLSDQFKSFAAREHIPDKIISTPKLFSIENYPYAWSYTIRNHDYIFNNTEQLEKNKKLISGKKKKEKDKLYLGRYVRFTKGIKDSVLNMYDSIGAPVNGNNYLYSKQAAKYVHKIVDLCNSKNIELLFLTLPMYAKHVENYDAWKKTLQNLLGNYDKKWLDMQLEEHDDDFPPLCFENTYSANQHLTLQGSLIASYKLAHYIKNQTEVDLPKRHKENNWHRMFYGEEGYFENYPVSEDDKKHKIVLKDKKIQNIVLDEIALIDDPKNKRKKLIVKIDRSKLENKELKKSKLVLLIKVVENNKERVSQVQLNYDILHETLQNAIFIQVLKPVDVIDVVDGKLFS